jgi:tetratricopeptide (TPR) repeat protein
VRGGAEERRGRGGLSLPCSPALFLLLRSSAPLLLSLSIAARLLGQPAPEEAARRFAAAAVQGPRADFAAALDADALLEKKVGPEVWRGLTERQRNVLRAVTRERFAGMLAPPSSAASTAVAWSQELKRQAGLADVVLGIAIGEKTLKTRWRLRSEASGWRIQDVVLTDPGISLASAAVSSLGAQPVRREPWWPRAARQVVPWLALLAILGIVLRLTAPSIPVERRRVLYRAAAIPAAVALAGAAVAAVRVATQPWVVHVEGGGAPSPVSAYDRGLAAKQAGETDAARRAFEEALASPAPANGAARELAAMELETGRLSAAEARIDSYLAAAGPDPDSLALKAVIEANLGKPREAVEAVAAARRLLGPGPRAAELEAKIRARASDAAGAIAALRPLLARGLSREALRSDPAYLAIATDPAWVRFLNEKEAR